MESQINFFKEKVQFRLTEKEALRKWISKVIKKAGWKQGAVNFIFCTNNHLLKMNREYLQHDYFTDVITFDNSTEGKTVEGDIFISTDMVSSNAERFGVTFSAELRRVMIHGVLHLLGEDDSTTRNRKKMKKREDDALNMFSGKL